MEIKISEHGLAALRVLRENIEEHYHVKLNDSQAIEIALEYAAITSDMEPSRLYLAIDNTSLLSDAAKAAMRKAQDEKFEEARQRRRGKRKTKTSGEGSSDSEVGGQRPEWLEDHDGLTSENDT